VVEGVGRERDGTRSAERNQQSVRRVSGQPWLIGFACVCIAAMIIEALQPPLASIPELRSMISAWTAVAAFVAAHALVLDFRETWRLRPLLLFLGVALLGSVLGVSSILLEVIRVRASESVTAGPAFASVIAAALLAAAAVTPQHRTLPVHRRWERIGLVAVLAIVCATEVLGKWLVGAIDPASNTLRGISAEGRPWAVAIFVATIVMFGLSAARFAGEQDDEHSSALSQLAAGCLLLAFAPAERIITPAPSADVLSVAVITELAGFCLIALAARRGLQAQRLRAREAAAVNAARTRLARDLHDGLCQDLAFVVAHTSALTGETGEQHSVAIAAERALATARGLLDEFAVSGTQTDVASALRAVAAELASRFSIAIEIRAQMLDLSSADTEDLVRIAREAIVNAARHGVARKVTVELSGASSSFVLRVTDDGRGMQPAGSVTQGFGMTAMQERAARLGGWVTTRPARSGGTELRVVVSR
jgi:signal transduction histidine kinase